MGGISLGMCYDTLSDERINMQDVKQVLDLVNTFYSNAYNQLIVYTVGLLAFLGAVVPSILTVLSNRALRKENEKLQLKSETNAKNIEEALEIKLTAKIETTLKGMEEEYLRKMEAKIAETKSDLEKLSNQMTGSVYHLQATHFRDQDDPNPAFDDCITSTSHYIDAGDEMNMQHTLSMAKGCLSKLFDSDFEENSGWDARFSSLMDKLSGINKANRYSDLIRNMNKAFTDAKKRVRPPQQPPEVSGPR